MTALHRARATLDLALARGRDLERADYRADVDGGGLGGVVARSARWARAGCAAPARLLELATQLDALVAWRREHPTPRDTTAFLAWRLGGPTGPAWDALRAEAAQGPWVLPDLRNAGLSEAQATAGAVVPSQGPVDLGARPLVLPDPDVVVLDTETGGLAAARVALLQVAFVVVSPDLVEERARGSQKVQPRGDLELTAEAARVNGYSPAAWAGAPDEAEVLARLSKALPDRFVLVGHQINFDVRVLEAAAARCRMSPCLDRAVETVCTLALARRLQKRGVLPVASCGLGALRAHFGLPDVGAHRALADVVTCLAVLRELRTLERASALRGVA